LSVRAIGRTVGVLSSGDNWPGTAPRVQLLEGYAQYAVARWTAQVGRQTVATRFGLTGFDGGRLTVRDARRGLELTGYAGWGLWRGSALPVTSPALNPLDEFRPPERTIVAGAGAGWTSPRVDARVTYEREVEPSVDYFVSERAGLDVVARPYAGVSLAAGADYDMAQGWWGTASATLSYVAPGGRVRATAGVRRYRPHFDLWTIWGAFSPVPYTAVQGQLSIRPLPQVSLRAHGERYRYSPADVSTPLVDVEQSGWRGELGVTASPVTSWTFDAGYTRAFGPGAASVGSSASVTYAPTGPYAVTLHTATLDRPLELRFSESVLHLYGVDGRVEPRPGLRLELGAVRYAEDRRRPDPAAIDWGQWRVTLRAVFAIGSGDDLDRLPQAVRR